VAVTTGWEKTKVGSGKEEEEAKGEEAETGPPKKPASSTQATKLSPNTPRRRWCSNQGRKNFEMGWLFRVLGSTTT